MYNFCKQHTFLLKKNNKFNNLIIGDCMEKTYDELLLEAIKKLSQEERKDIPEDMVYKSLKSVYESKELSLDEIVDYLKCLGESKRNIIYIYSLSDNNELSIKISKANQIISKNNILSLKSSYRKGMLDDFLSNLDWKDKCTLVANLLHLKPYDDIMPISKNEIFQLVNLINKSIEEEISTIIKKNTEIIKNIKEQILLKEDNAISQTAK